KGFFLFSLFALYAMLTALFLTQSVGSWLGLILTAFIFLVIRGSWKRRAIVSAITLILLFVSVHSWGQLRKVQAFNDYFHLKMASRLFFWNLGLTLIKDHPLSGIGMNRVRLRSDVGYESAHLHNHLLHTAAEMGLPALLAYLAMLFIAGYMSYKIYREVTDGWVKAAALGLSAGQMAHFFYGLTDSIPFGAKPGIFFWISLALINALYNSSLKTDKI
ncbi:MAG: O-antigen ligase family protein, partial [Candidatus Aminicenantes bacterium]|nr:O-antigen ligase family protein [Candidatus Aminicenantes bacterium]